jgi:glycerophosphoryl diester phosphodiesterase
LFFDTLKLSGKYLKQTVLESLFISMFIGLIITPLFSLLFRLIMRINNVSIIHLDNLKTIITEHYFFPIMLFILLILFILAIYGNLIYLLYFFDNLFQGKNLTRKKLFIMTFKKIKNINFAEFFLVLLFILIIAPISSLLFHSDLTSDINIPSFITSELMKSSSFVIISIIFYIFFFLLAYKLLFMLPAIVLNKKSPWNAIKYSFSMTKTIKSTIIIKFHFFLYSIIILIFVILIVFLSALIIEYSEKLFPNIIPFIAAFCVLLVEIGVFISIAVGTSITFFYILFQMKGKQKLKINGTYKKRFKYTIGNFIILSFIFIILSLLFLVNLGYFLYEQEVDIITISHRGDTTKAVENSIEALEFANEANATYVEMDILETLDEKFVVYHDRNLNRLASLNINVQNKRLDELIGILIRNKRFTSEIVSFDDYIDRSDELEQKLLIEIKTYGYESKNLVDNFIDRYASRIIENGHIIHTLDLKIALSLKQKNPDLVVGYIMPLSLGGLPDIDIDFFVVEETFVSDALIEEAEREEKKIFVWTVNSEENMRRQIILNVHGIITDEIHILNDIINLQKNQTYLEKATNLLTLKI